MSFLTKKKTQMADGFIIDKDRYEKLPGSKKNQ